MFMRLQGIRAEAMCLSTGQLQQRKQQCSVAATLPSTNPILSPSPAADVGPWLQYGIGTIGVRCVGWAAIVGQPHCCPLVEAPLVEVGLQALKFLHIFDRTR